MTKLDDLFRDPLPDRDTYILKQAIPFNPDQWTTRLPNEQWWPKPLSALPRTGRWPTVDRQTVFRMAEHSETPEGRRALLIATLVWGTGTSARSIARRVRIFHENDLDWLDHRIAAATTEIDRGDPVAAFLVLNDRDARVKHLGPAFFSKLLYFASAGHPTGGLLPLIIDSNVALALDELSPHSWAPDERWDSKKYANYLDLAHSWAERFGVEADMVERKLFERGKQVRAGTT
ncbi:hypothetical protein ACFV5J_00885 [Streptomyces zaomyceticus]|uniref:8-oxoguanine DNA glycosylase OGG fold protein n=1 Tax=Streptomyces zaomyceticus TaxID=68286 RepID=UPI003646EE1E